TGHLSSVWSETPMTPERGEDGCPSFKATVQFDPGEVDKTFRWSVRLDAPGAPDISGIPTEIHDANSAERYREFVLQQKGSKQVEEFYFTYARRLGARKHFKPGSNKPNLRFSVWAPNAQKVEVVFGRPANGYIANDGDGIDPARPVLPMKKGGGGIWE